MVVKRTSIEERLKELDTILEELKTFPLFSIEILTWLDTKSDA